MESVVVTGEGTMKAERLQDGYELKPHNNLTAIEKLEITTQMAKALADLHGNKGGIILSIKICSFLSIYVQRISLGMPKKLQCSPGRKKYVSLFLDCLRGMTKHREYWNKWIVDKCWIDVINEQYDMPESIQFTAVELNQAISRNAAPGCINSISKRPKIILVFNTSRCKPKCSLWDFSCCPKLV
jgi:hypothetical protein